MRSEGVSDQQIIDAAKNYRFGDDSPIAIVKRGLLVRLCGYCTGHSVSTILSKLGLLTPAPNFNLTKKGKHQAWEWHKEQLADVRREALEEFLEKFDAGIDARRGHIEWEKQEKRWIREILAAKEEGSG